MQQRAPTRAVVECATDADIFAFGVVLYEMLSGSRPFEGKSHASLVGAILDHEPPRIGTLNPGIPPLADELVARCLAKDRDERWQTMRDLMRQIEWLSNNQTAASPLTRSSTPARPSGRALALRVAAALVIGAIVAGGAVAWRPWPSTPAPPIVNRFTFDLPEGQSFTRTGRHSVALSPDGSPGVRRECSALPARDERAVSYGGFGQRKHQSN